MAMINAAATQSKIAALTARIVVCRGKTESLWLGGFRALSVSRTTIDHGKLTLLTLKKAGRLVLSVK